VEPRGVGVGPSSQRTPGASASLGVQLWAASNFPYGKEEV
jgi:hypothetical protein